MLQLAVPLSSFVMVKVPIRTGKAVMISAETAGTAVEAAESGFVDMQTSETCKMADAIMNRQLGGPVVAFAVSLGQCQVVCHKVYAPSNASVLVKSFG